MKIKKLLTFTLLLLIVLFSKGVFADMGAPMIKAYTAYVSNPEGADYYSYDSEIDGYKKEGKLAYGTNIEVENEYEIDGIPYAYFWSNDSSKEYNIKIQDIKTEGTTILEEDINYDEPVELKILAKEGVKMYEGPAYVYSETEVTIPKNQEIKAYMLKEYGFEGPWYYTEYDGTSGWICILEGVAGRKPYTEKLILPKDTKIYENADMKKSIGKIPANTTFTDFMDVDSWSRAYYVTYNGISGYISHYDTATDWGGYEWTVNYKNAKMYKTGSLSGEIIASNIPIGTVLKAEYETDIRMSGWMYTTYNGKKGWVFVVENSDEYEEAIKYEKLDEEAEEEVAETIIENEEDNTNVTNTTNINDNAVVAKESNINKEVNSKTLSPTIQMILLCVFVGVVIGVTGMTVLLLINKKKK